MPPSGDDPSVEPLGGHSGSASELDLLVDRAAALAVRLARGSEEAPPGRRPDAGGHRGGHAAFAAIAADPASRRFVQGLTDEVMRIRDPSRALSTFRKLVSETGVPGFASFTDGVAIRAGTGIGRLAPGATMSVLRRRMRSELSGVVHDAREPGLTEMLSARHAAGDRCNLNLLGEVVLGDDQGAARTAEVCELLGRTDLEGVSVKLSGLCANMSTYAVERTVRAFADRLRSLLGSAAAVEGAPTVTLDMERYDELFATAEAFVSVLSEPELRGVEAGIALQAYLPDALGVASRICAWASQRREAGGAPVRVRLVKGANLAMERVESELRGWRPATFDRKADTDANYKRVLAMLLDPAWGDAVRVGLASHNLFDLAWGLTLAEHLGASERIEVEMLAGMAEREAAAVVELGFPVLLYTPVVRAGDFDSAVSYLARRFEETTSEGSFLADMFHMSVGDDRWEAQELGFRSAVGALWSVPTQPRRNQDRAEPAAPTDPDAPFANAPDTDWVHAPNRAWITEALLRPAPAAPERLDSPDLLDDVVARAASGSERARTTSLAARRELLCTVADVLEARREELIATMVGETSKVVVEADSEVSEAVDFARYYASCLDLVGELLSEGLHFTPFGVVVVAGPWNFPVSIPAGGVLAALAAGAAVVLKPAPEAVGCGRLLAECLWQAGVGSDALQLAAVPDGAPGRHLVTHAGVEAVLLTGSLVTARRFLDWQPGMRLLAETSGKNAMVITQSADLDLAIGDLVRSAFGHAGQKCSAASLAICLGAVYDDPGFRGRLADAVRSLRVGPAEDPATDVPPLIGAPSESLERALTTLEAGEEWLVEPRCLDEDRRTWTPGVRLGVRPGSFFQRTECFGPVLGLMRAPDLDTAVAWQNDTAFGLTGGIHSLDLDELRRWCELVEVGNAYLNRSITGAIVRRQPFGGWKDSTVGPTAKAGGPDAVLALGRWSRGEQGGGLDVARAVRSFDQWWDGHFGIPHDPSGLRCEANVLRYLPVPSAVLRAGTGTTDEEIVVAVGAATVVGAKVEVSVGEPRPSLKGSLPAEVVVRAESEATFVERVAGRVGNAPRVRVLGGLTEPSMRALNRIGSVVDDHPVLDHGRIELMRWTRAQSVSVTLHRHGVVQERFREVL